ncbi:hypothetical protein KJ742_01725 [Patescibacteria group bacterium]|nr:hypothetical protein [Patescibacteria group bacterium]
MIVKADYHMHPNLPKGDKEALEKSKKWWEAIGKAGVNCVVIAEHVYKNAKRAFDLMSQACPDNIFCFPGIEYCTKEGVDIVVFSNSEKIYKEKPLNTTFGMTYRETIDYIKERDYLYAYVTHPFTLGTTSIVNILGMDQFEKYTNELNAVEVSNGAFDTLMKVFKTFPISLFTKKKLDWAQKTQRLPETYRPKNPIFLAAGSDAHLFQDLGNHFELVVSSFDRETVFDKLVNNTDGQLVLVSKKFSLLALLKNLPIVLSEFLIKKRIRLCSKFSCKRCG